MNKHKLFIKDCYEGKHGEMCSSWKETILKHYPEFKEEEFKVGDWIIGNDTGFKKNIDSLQIARITSINIKKEDPYTVFGGYMNNSPRKMEWGRSVRKATKEEIEKHLIKEAERRGYPGSLIKNSGLDISTPEEENKIKKSNPDFEYCDSEDSLWGYSTGDFSICIYRKGEWAEIIETITKEEAEKQLGKKII